MTATKAPVTTAIATAWQRYLTETRGVTGVRYAEIEPWAWARLQAELRGKR